MKNILVLKPDSISGFSYSFAKGMVDRFDQLLKEDRIYEMYSSGGFRQLTPIAKNLIHYLKNQIPYAGWEKISISVEYADYSEHNHLDEKAVQRTFDELKEKIIKALNESYTFIGSFME